VLIYNPNAGKLLRDNGLLVERIVEALNTHGHHVTVAPTQGAGTATAIARGHVASGARLIIAVGGDGTINEVAEGMIHSHVPLAILPAGTANVLASELKLGWDVVREAGRIGEFVPSRISLGHVTCDGGRVSRHFVLMAGIGLDAHIVYHVSGPLKSQAGKLAYWIAGGSVLGKRLPQIRAEAGGKRYVCSFALLSKVRNYGGDFEIARDVSLFDNRFEAVLFEGGSAIRYVPYLVALMMRRLKGMRGVTVIRTNRMKLSSGDSRVYVQIDGEYAGRLPAKVEVVPDALTILLPPDYGKKAG
jgi:diacylglycerol kinase (ATP)